jgi:hypothetical protein
VNFSLAAAGRWALLKDTGTASGIEYRQEVFPWVKWQKPAAAQGYLVIVPALGQGEMWFIPPSRMAPIELLRRFYRIIRI